MKDGLEEFLRKQKPEEFIEPVKPIEPIKVCTGVSSARDWKVNFGISYSGMIVTSITSGVSISPAIVRNTYIHEARNFLVRMALDAKADYLLFLDDDMEFPTDALLRLLKHKKDIIGPIYARRVAPHVALGQPLIDGEPIPQGGLTRMDYIPTGFLLVKMTVFKKLKAPWFTLTHDPKLATKENPDGLLGEDVYFCRQARKAGYTVWCDYDLTWEIHHTIESFVKLSPPGSKQDGKSGGG